VEPLQHYRAMEAFCRQHARMDGESEGFWLAAADDWANRLSDERLSRHRAGERLKDVEAERSFAPGESSVWRSPGLVPHGHFSGRHSFSIIL
jgi:hypothetical protein